MATLAAVLPEAGEGIQPGRHSRWFPTQILNNPDREKAGLFRR
ncbi:hypothetical protein F385_2231 [Pantoea agglomerans 299R]|jgi:hypothetical protein|nr:hypothetical protein F385_2231 [Pantoea agglomerans 299R]